MKTLLRPAAALGLAVALALGAGACDGATGGADRAGDTDRPGADDRAERAERADAADGTQGTGGTGTGDAAGADNPATGTRPPDGGLRIGLLLPENTTTRYERFDKPFFEAEITRLCPPCEVRYANAYQRADTQRQQAEAMLAGGVDALVLAAVDTRAAAAIVGSAHARGIPVIAYDRLAEGPISGYVSFDDEAVGRMQGTALLQAIRRGGDAKRAPVVMADGSPADPAAVAGRRGAHQALDGHVIIGREYDTPGGLGASGFSGTADPSGTNGALAAGSFEAAVRDGTAQALTALGGPGKVAGVHAADDRTAGGVIAALKAAGFASPLPPVTGRGATPAALRRIIAGDQYMTVFTPCLPEARAAAAMALAAASGTPYTAANAKRNNGTADVDAVILEPVAVTRANLKDTVLRKPYYGTAEICTPEYAEECRAAGLG
ncbi:substrate-binding domain-containing protein [Yinghuangia sp. ASG 101]|uniref:substrate-binding domain-containing protein n=1 Tax=Yinghuangia sp. ASG 101 TaxID=2896848 RepID=UPI001E527EFA|nr:substrate-binding domain-containing protein [Yinghuangia sp. ASG 101]UGQ13799.1 substrate-binding domain-containing protein [Yinghuangia sp. ASG 101]